MAEAKDFVLWFLQNLPNFLLSEPINLFVGFVFLAWTISLFRRLTNL